MHGKSHSVLIADDNEIDRFFLKRAINKGASRLNVVCEVDDGEDVVAYLTGRGIYSDRHLFPVPDLLILDTRMRRMDGLGVLRWLQTQNFSELRVAMFADSSGTNLQSRALGSGASFFFSKIVHEPELIQMVKTLEDELDRGKRMVIVLQHLFTKCFFKAPDCWTPLLHEGWEFGSVDEAAEFARGKGLAEVAQVALSFSANGQTFFFPVRPENA